jgi:hypothetical protein
MTIDVNFDVLARKTIESGGAMEDLNDLYGHAFALPQWHFIARGEFPNLVPFIAANAAYADGQYMVRAFTDTERLERFARENKLTVPNSEALILSIPTAGIVDYLEQFIARGVHGIWFNSDTGSEGFNVPLVRLRPISEHLAKNWRKADDARPAAPAPKTPPETLIVVVKDGLMLPSGFFAPASYTCNFFCRVPPGWVEGERLKEERLEQIYRKVYGETWRSGNSDGSRYVVQDAFSQVKSTDWTGSENDRDNHYWFYLASPDEEIRNVTAAEFQADVDESFQP